MSCKVIVKNVTKSYRDVTALKGVSFEAGPGVHSFLGPNGSGKSTLLSIIAGALRPDSGEVEICGYSLWGKEGVKVRELIGYSPQDPPIKPLLSGFENLVYQGLLRGLSLGEAKRKAKELLELVGLEEAARRRAGEYSGGMKKRYSLAVALINDPKVLILDEPSTGLDPDARRTLWSILKEVVKGGERVVIVATHYAEEAERLSDMVYIMHRGEILAKGAPDELKREYGPSSKIVVEVKGELKGCEGALKGLGLEWRTLGEGALVFYSQSPYEAVPRVAETLIRERYYVRSIRIEEPTLEDVFFRVTGARLEGG